MYLVKYLNTIKYLVKYKKGDGVMEVEYRCNNCGEYFYAESEGMSTPSCPNCGSDDVWDF